MTSLLSSCVFLVHVFLGGFVLSLIAFATVGSFVHLHYNV